MSKNFKNSVKNITITVEDAVKKLKSNEYSVDFIAQRSDEQWSDEQKVNLLDSIFCGIVLPDMVIVQCEGKDEVIDGKQRLTTLKNYIKSKPVVDKETTETTEVSANPEATKETAEVASTDVSSTNGVSSEATADASSDTSVATNEDSASDSSEADADPAKDVSDGTEVVA